MPAGSRRDERSPPSAPTARVLGEELARIGYAGTDEPGFLKPHAYVELHIEQGPVLEREGVPIGAVENLQGISWQRVTIEGAANHAGTTPMSMRRDAGYAAARVVTFLRDRASASNAPTVATVGTHRASSRTPSTSSPRARSSPSTCAIPTSSACRTHEAALAAYLDELAAAERRDDRRPSDWPASSRSLFDAGIVDTDRGRAAQRAAWRRSA